MSPRVKVERTYLELRSLKDLKPAKVDDDLLRLARVPVPSVPLVQRLYREVGEAYHWVDRWEWSTDQWTALVERPGYGLWILTWDGALAGFLEMQSDDEDGVEISLLGLTREFQGRGFGKHLLTMAVEIGFAIGGTRVWLHTCTLDAPAALPNYLARGFVEFKKETYDVET